MKEITEGIVEYIIAVKFLHDRPPDPPPGAALWKADVRHNIPEERTVSFDGTRSLTEEDNTDFNYKSKAIKIYRAPRRYYYAKELPVLNFWYEVKEPEPVQEYYPEDIVLRDEYKKIAGYRCQLAAVTGQYATAKIFFTEEIILNDPTGAVLSREGIRGTIMELTETPVAKEVYFVTQYTVRAIHEQSLPKAIFHIPPQYLHFKNSDDVSKRYREIMKQKALAQKPGTDTEKYKFTGYWLSAHGDGDVLVEIKYTGPSAPWENRFSFKEAYLPANNSIEPRYAMQTACQYDEWLAVEDTGGFRFYQVTPSGDRLYRKDNTVFAYRKITPGEASAIMEKYGLRM